MNRAEWEEKNKKDKSASPNIANSAEPYKFGATTLDVASNILFGAIKGLEGIYDVGATVVGAVGGLFDKEFQADVKEKVAFDWTGKNIDFGGAVDGSLINRMGEKGQNIVRGVAQGLGQMLPAVGMNALLPGSGLATIATSAAGGGTERAFQDNAEYGKGMLYGAVVGTVEALTEKMTGGFTKGVFGKGFLDDAIEAAINKTSKSALFKVAMNFAEEGFEEMVATAVEPAIRELYQKGAAKETFTKEHAEDILYDGLIGGLTGIVYGGTVGQIGAKSRNVYESAQELKNIDEKKTRLWEKDKLDDTAETKLNAEKEATQLELKKRLAKLSDVKREQLTKRLNLDLDEQGNFRSYEAEDGYNKGAYSPTLHGKESALAYKPVKTELTDAQKSAVKLNSTLNKIMRVKTDVVIAEDLGTTPDGNKIGATFDKGVLYIDSSIDDKTLAKRKVIHEITHSLESLGKTAYTNFRSAMMKAVEENAEVKKLLDPKGNLREKTIKAYESQLFDTMPDGTKVPKTAFEQNYIVTTEIMAQYAEVLFTDEKVIERLAQENRTLVQKIYNKIKNYIEYLKQRKENPELANFLRQAEKLYKKALESSAQRSTLTDAKAIGEIMEGKQTETKDTERKPIDSDGNALSPEQAEFFKDSKARDEKGNLIVMYHSTSENFSTFDISKARSYDGRVDYELPGLYFTPNKQESTEYGNRTVKSYLNIKNPFMDDLTHFKKDNGLKTWRDVLDMLISKGYDGAIDEGDEYIAFYSNQIKLTTNLDPTDSDDIRYAIEDFGEKIGGARKDVWMPRGLQIGDLQFLNDAELDKYVKKNYVWRPINYKKEAESGTERGALLLYKETRDSIPTTLYIFRNATQDEKNQKREIYVDTINKIKNGIEKVKTVDDLTRLVDEIFVKPGYIEKQGERYATTKLFYTNPALDVALFNNWQRRVKRFDLLDADAQREKIGLDTVEKQIEDFKIKQKEDGKYYIFRKSWGGFAQVSDVGFENETVAGITLRLFLEKQKDAKQTKRKERLVPPQLDFINRKGIDYRSNKNITGDDYLSVFKFRGGEFGNWLNESDRQTSLNYGYDALMDLADALNITKEGISLNGDLAIAFGARGQGLTGAAAHYESERRVINLTKMYGAGSLAHEWFHAVDHYIAGKDSKSLASQLSSYEKSIPEKTRAALYDVIQTMKYHTRLQTEAETDARVQRVYESAKRYVDRAFSDYFKYNFEVDQTPEHLAVYGKKRRNANAEEKKQYQELKKRVYNGDQQAWIELDKLRKTVTNRQIPRGDNAASYTFDQILYQIPSLNVENRKAAFNSEEAPTIKEETDYFKNSKRMGELAQKDGGYWDSPEEMLARAFATYIHDKTGKNNDYLSAHAEAMVTLDADKDGEPIVVKAFPEGEERVKINKAFDVLFDAMKQDGFFTEFTGVRPLQIVSYKSNSKGDSGQTLFTQEPMAERKEPQIKEVIKEKETSDMPLTPSTEFHTKPTQMELFGEGKAVQLSLFDDNTRFSILAADDKTIYKEQEVKKAMTESLAERLFMGNEESGMLDKVNERELMQMFADKIKNSKNKEKTADELAEFVIQRAVIEETFEDDPNFMDDSGTKDYRIMKGYLHQFDLDSIRADVQYTFGKKTHVFGMWGKRKGTRGETPDVIAQELEEYGIRFDAINPADIFIQFVKKYQDLSDRVHKRNQIIRRSLRTINGFMLDKIKNDLKKDFLSIIENEGRPAVPKDIAKVKNAEIKELDAKIKAMAEEIARMENEAGEQTEKSAKMREELWVMDHNYDRLNLELKEDKDFINSMVAIHKLAKEDIRRISNKLADTQKRHRAEMALFERIDRVKNLTQYMGAGVQLADEVIGLIKLLKKQKTWRGKLTADIRNIMKTYSRKTDGVPLYDLLSQDENLYADEIQAIANGQGELTTAEIITLKDVLDKFVHDVREYDRVYWQGEKAHATEVGANLIEETRKTIPFKKGWLANEWRKIDNALEAPYWRFMRLSNYDDNGIMAKMFWELKDALNKRDGFSMKVVKHFEEFYKKNQKLVDSWRDTVDLNGVKISKGQAMALYLSSFREQMQNHLYNQTGIIVTDKGISVSRKGTIKLVDEKKALKSMREAFENATEQKITEEWVQGLLSQFNAEEREYMRLVHDFFNVISAEAKTETDFALNGIRGDLEKHYFPIRVASDQIFKKIGDKMFADLFTVYKPSFTKKVVKNAKNMVVIENITDVVNRHARQMADYYGFAVAMKTFTRIWNAKTENGTARQAVQKVDPLFEKYVDKLFMDMQHNVPEREGFDKLVSKFMGWGATAALAANPKVWVNQMVALFAGHGIGIKYSSLMKGLKNALKQKGDYSTMFENSPFLFARFNDGFNVASGALLEKKGLFGKASKLTELTLQPIEYLDKLMIAGVWNAAMIESNNDVKKAAELTEKAVIITQQNFTPLFRPEILRTNSSLLRLSTMFMSEPLQMFSQLFGAIDRRRVAKELKKRAVTPEEHAKADQLLAEANQKMKLAFTTITVDLILLTLIAQAFSWIKGKDDEEKFAVGFGKELLSNFIGMFPFLRDAYSIIEGYDVTNMAYTGLTNITNAGKEIFTSVSDAVQGKYQSGQEISAGIRKTIIGLSQTFGIPVRNIESYVKGIVEKVSPSAGETYESWFWKKSDAEYQKVLDEALEKGNDRLADTVIDLMLKKRLTVGNDTVTKELKALYKTGQQVVPSIVQPTITHNGESIELSARDYKQFVDVYSQANKEAETLIQSQAYRVLNDTVKADAVKLIYDYFYNLAKSELVGESTARYIDLTGIPVFKLAIILAQTKNLTADKDEQGKSISGTKKYKVERALVGLYLTQAQKQKIMEYLGYAI